MERLHHHSTTRATCCALIAPSALSALLLLAPGAQAQMLSASASDPKSAVPSIIYRSVFKETSLGIEQERIDWRKANNDVGRFERGHVDILKAEELEEKKMPAPSTQTAPLPASRSTSTAPAAAPSAPAIPPKAAPAHKH